MSRVEDITRALSDSFQEYDESLRRRLGDLRDGQTDTSDHLIDVNDDHQVTPEDAGLGHIENYPIATTFVIDEQTDPNQYVDLQGAIHYIRTNLNLGQIVDSGDPISPIGGMDVNNLRPKLRGGAYFNAYGIARKHRRYQLVLATGDFDAPLLDVVVTTGDDLVLGSDLNNLTEYKWRYKDVSVDDIEGPWKVGGFRVAYEIVLTPTLTVQGGTNSTSLSPVFIASPFTVNTGTDTHASSVWTLYDALGAVIETYTKTTGDLTTWTPSTVLEIVTEYRAEVYYTADNYEQSGVAEVTFETTDGIIEVPSVTVPNSPNDPFTIDLAWNGTDPAGLDTHISSSLRIARDANFTDIVVDVVETVGDKTSILVDNLADLTTHYVRAKLHGDTLGSSAWSPVQSFTTGVFEGATTEITDPTGDVIITSGTGFGQDSILGGKSVQSPAQPMILYRSPQGVQWAKRLTGIVTEGYITSVVVDANYIYATGVSEDESTAFIVSLNLSGGVRWCKEYSAGMTTVLKDLVLGDKIYACGYSDGYNGTAQAGTCGIVMAFTSSGALQWARTIGGMGTDRFHGINYESGSVYVVGDQASDFGTTVTASRCASVVSLTVAGVKQWERYWSVGNDCRYDSATTFGSNLFVGGRSDGAPLLSLFGRTTGDLYDHRMDLTVSGHVNKVGLGHDNRLFVSGESDVGSFLFRATPSHNAGIDWSVMDNQPDSGGFLLSTDNGIELVSSMALPGRVSTVISRVPDNGGVSTPPYVTGYDWTPWSTTLPDVSGVEAQIYGAWSEWEAQDVSVTRRVASYSTPPAVTAGDISSAEQEGYIGTTEREVRGLSFANPQAESVMNTYTTTEEILSTYRGISSTNGAPDPNYYASSITHASHLVPSNSGNRAYVYKSHSYGGMTTGTSYWKTQTDYFYDADYSGNGASQAAAWQISQHMGKIADGTWTSDSTATREYEAAYARHKVYARYKTQSQWPTWRLYYDVITTHTNYVTEYRWTLQYEYRNRVLSPVLIPLTNPTPTPVNVTPTTVAIGLDLTHSNF